MRKRTIERERERKIERKITIERERDRETLTTLEGTIIEREYGS